MLTELAIGAGVTALGAGWAWWQVRRRNLHRWLTTYVRERSRRRDPHPQDEVHALIAVCDHYEPKQWLPPPEVSRACVRRWVEEYPRLFGHFRDSDGRSPCHTFFYPEEEYEAEYLDMLGELCRAGFGEVELHLHHDNDTADNLRRTLLAYKDTLATRHGMLSRHRHTGELMYAFIHGNWALDNSRPDGRCCGINNELDVLRETGCYADFTLPSAPSPCQTSTINRIYYAVDDPARPKSHDTGFPIAEHQARDRSLLLIQGPLLLDWSQRKRGMMPGLENGCLQRSQPPSAHRLDLWLRARVQVPTRPDWYFIKLHAHGAEDVSQDTLLGEPMVRFHEALAARARANPHFHFHYVSAREMYNLAKAAEAGWTGDVAGARDFLIESLLASPCKTPDAAL